MSQPSSSLSNLLIEVAPITPKTTVAQVGEMFLGDTYKALLSLPVVEEGKPVGVITRYEVMRVFLLHFGREVYGARPVEGFMKKPLLVEFDRPLKDAAQYITGNIDYPVTEDYIFVCDQGLYQGMGVVLDMLKAMEGQLSRSAVELARAYRSLQESQTQLVQSEKMASLGQMVAGVAHEINTPLGYVKNNVEMSCELFGQAEELVIAGRSLLGAMSEDVDEEEFTQRIEDFATLADDLDADELFEDTRQLFEDTLFGVAQISELVGDLKNFSRLDQAKLDEVSINECIESSLNIGKNVVKQVMLTKKLAEDLPRIACAPSQINQVFLNFITNAVQAIGHDKGQLLIKSLYDEDWVHVDIQDNGAGIPDDVRKKIFDPFFTTKAVGEGTGLGLSISYKIIQEHGGRIFLATKVGEGTRFRISLPRREDVELRKAG